MAEDISLYNTFSRRKEKFIPIDEKCIGLYTCGPTVYNYAHIGNLRTFIFEDILKKTLSLSGYKVKHVMNITDVGHLSDDADNGEDKVEKAAKKEKKTIKEIVEFYTDAFLKDINALNIKMPDVLCKASDHIEDMIKLIQRIEKNGHTYISGGNVYFSIDTFKDYGKLAMLDGIDLRAGERIEVDKKKKNPHDFVLWFTSSKFDNQSMKWPSVYGVGYPGWHIECSAMSMKYLGEHFDIHCGGVDAINVHHTNEIAQSEAATGKKWVNYWLHGEFLLSEKGKMSKSTGEFTTLELLKSKGFSPLSYRYFCLQAHYRKQLQFSYDALSASQNALFSTYKKVDEILSRASKSGDVNIDNNEYTKEFKKNLFNDLNTPSALAILNKVIASGDLSWDEKLSFVKMADSVFSLGLLDKRNDEEIPDEIKDLAEKRLTARKEKQYALSDELRNKIKELGYDIKDNKDGYTLEKL